MIWWIVALVVIIAVLAFVLQRRGSSGPGGGADSFHDAGAPQAPESFRTRPEGTGGTGGLGPGS